MLDIVLLALVLLVAAGVLIDVRVRALPSEEAAEPGRDTQREPVSSTRSDSPRQPELASDQGRTEPVPAGQRGTSPLAIENWSVRSRLLLLVSIPSITALAFAGARIASSLQSTAMVHGPSAARDRAITSLVLVCVVVLIVLALAVVTTVIVGRSMVRPLRRLQAGALDVAERRLPAAVAQSQDGEEISLDVEPIDVTSTDEIGGVARAFDQVHREALRLARSEAALRTQVNSIFVNLSRRSQSLVTRQIRLIDDLEQGEQDPERLSSLFQMDHLATRMRRNSENLLVLAGHEETRRWNDPLPLVDVLRASLSEIEHYERITLNVQPGIVVRGQVVSDLVHLTAELAENATSFSAVETPVAMSGHLLGSGGALLEITDQGVGMGSEDMAHANWRLDNPPVVDVAVSRRMGLFVVARLAARHGIRVRLRSAEPVGLVALVWLPDEAIMRESPDMPLNLRDPAAASDPGPAETGLRFPARFAPLRVDAVDAGATSPDLQTATSPDLQTTTLGPQPTAASVAAAGPPDADPLPGDADERHETSIAVPAAFPAPAALLAEDVPVSGNRLPIFEAVESDWFRRGGQAIDRFGRDGLIGDASWASRPSEGWRAAETVLEPASSGVTAAGLPKRTPRANLVPGTAAVASPTGTQAPPSTRSAAATRDRFASFQRGVRQGRAVVGGEGPDDGEDVMSNET
jgi:signal transduction histidine kinase